MSRLRGSSRVVAGLVAAAVVIALAGCGSAPAAQSRPSVSSPRAVCPSAEQVSALTAASVTRAVRNDRCVYTAQIDGDRRSVVVQHPASATLPRTATLSAVLDEVSPEAGSTERDAPDLDVPAAVTRAPDGSCTIRVYATDGVATSVAGRGAGACALAGPVAALTGAAPNGPSRPVVDVVVPPATGEQEREVLQRRIATATGARVRLIADGAADPAAARAVHRGAAAVVLVGAASGPTPLAVARTASQTFSAITARSPRARLLVVAPPSRSSASSPAALRAAARVAGATWIDAGGAPIDGGRLADAIVRSLRADVL